MSEKIYALLLRLHSSQFRQAYGEEALQLFRDRARDERGFYPRLRLWLDLLADLAISVPRGYGHVQPDLIGALAQRHLDGVPSFSVLGGESPRCGALLLGGMLSLVTLSALPVSISHFGTYRPPRASFFAPLHSAYAQWTASSHPAAQAAGNPASAAARVSPGDAQPNAFQSKPALAQGASGLPQPPAQPPAPPGAPRAPAQVVVEKVKLDAAARQRVIHGAIANLKGYYIDPGGAQKIADALLAHEKNGDYDAVTDGPAFAELLTRQLRDVSHDMQLDLVYSQRPLLDRPPRPTPEGLARYRQAMERANCTFEKVEILPHNIGYLKLNSFPDLSICRPAATAAMASLNHADAIIFDLRDNGGGYPDMVMLIASYLFDHPEYLYNPRENTTPQSWTPSPVPGNRLADKPVYLVTSAKTASGAEQFSYDLKMLKRATLVGETTRGSAHAGVFHRIDEHFGGGIREVSPINPFSTSDWEGTGVEPDVKVKAPDALERAKQLAESRLLQR
jgi:hypothetical protein